MTFQQTSFVMEMRILGNIFRLGMDGVDMCRSMCTSSTTAILYEGELLQIRC